jgi:hypothetical protein
MQIYNYDDEGFFVSESVADPDPLEEGNWLIPRNATTVAPITVASGSKAKFENGAWVEFTPPPEPVPAPPTAEELAAQARAQAKTARAAAVEAITVTVNGKVFDGDETSQTRMARAIVALQAAGVPSINWTLADNTVTDATLVELTEALILAGQAQAAIWTI